jgi:iron complex outermembrane receptor protein
LLRASWSQGFRSPNVPELFGGQSAAYLAYTDPCAPGPYGGGYKGGSLPPNCPGGTLDRQPTRYIHGLNGSNGHLEPEKSISRTFGFVYSPSQIPGLDVNADYFKIEITNEVGTVGFQNIVNGCFYNSSYCDLITVRSDQVTSIRNIETNVGDLLTEGVDVGLHYKFPSTPVGDFTASITGTFLRKWDNTVINRATRTGFATQHLAGFLNHSRRRFNGGLNWNYGNWSAHYRIEYIGQALDPCGVAVKGYCTYPNRTTDYEGVPGLFPLGEQHVGSTVYHDVHVGYTVPSINTTFGIGVNNLFDKIQPINGSGDQLSAGYYRLPSRFVYGSIRVRF